MINISLHVRKLPLATLGGWVGGGWAKICLNFNWGGILESNTQSAKMCLNESNTQSAKICLIFNFRGEEPLWSEIPERGSLENLDTNLLFEVSVQKAACASQIVSHILRMWRLINASFLITVRKPSCGKVMFLHRSVILFTCERCTPPPPPKTATAADSTHPTGMHSC